MRVLAALALCGILAAAAYMYLGDRAADAPQGSLEDGPVGLTIRMTKGGFIPATTTVTRGAVVLFLNDADAERWPASDLHPTHERYPAFDPRQPIAPGGAWRFRFDEAGTWLFHDHLHPNKRGVITVE